MVLSTLVHFHLKTYIFDPLSPNHHTKTIENTQCLRRKHTHLKTLPREKTFENRALNLISTAYQYFQAFASKCEYFVSR